VSRATYGSSPPGVTFWNY